MIFIQSYSKSENVQVEALAPANHLSPFPHTLRRLGFISTPDLSGIRALFAIFTQTPPFSSPSTPRIPILSPNTTNTLVIENASSTRRSCPSPPHGCPCQACCPSSCAGPSLVDRCPPSTAPGTAPAASSPGQPGTRIVRPDGQHRCVSTHA